MFVAVLVCVLGLTQWKIPVTPNDCLGQPDLTVVSSYQLLSAYLDPNPYPCSWSACCDISQDPPCEECVMSGICVGYTQSAWSLLDQEAPPPNQTVVCFDPVGPTPPLGAILLLRVQTMDSAGNLSLACP
jgi:hypothetical protein